MTFSIKRRGTWRNPYWRAEEVKNDRKILSRTADEYEDLDEGLFEEILREELDVPDYEPTEENVLKELGYAKRGAEMKPECLRQVTEYYRWRRDLFERIKRQVLSGRAELLLRESGASEVSFRYALPAEYNNFSCEEAPYDGGQVDACLEIGAKA